MRRPRALGFESLVLRHAGERIDHGIGAASKTDRRASAGVRVLLSPPGNDALTCSQEQEGRDPLEVESAMARSLPAKECVPRGMAFDSSDFRDGHDTGSEACGLGPPGGRNPPASCCEVRFLRFPRLGETAPRKLTWWSAALVTRKSRFDSDPGLPRRRRTWPARPAEQDARFSPGRAGFDSPAGHRR